MSGWCVNVGVVIFLSFLGGIQSGHIAPVGGPAAAAGRMSGK